MRTLAFVLALGLATPALAGGHGGFGVGGGCYGGGGFGVGLAPTYGVRAFAAPVMPSYGVQTFAAPVMSTYSVQSFAAPVGGCGGGFGAAGGCGGGGFTTFGSGIGYGAAPVVTATPVLVARRPGLRQRIRAARRGFRTGF